jgi:hypothetical protein
MQPILADDFRRQLTKPAITHLSPASTVEGSLVTTAGHRFTAGDVVVVDGVVATTTVISDSLLSFTVPKVLGGQREVQVRQTDGTMSNKASLYIRPTLSGVLPSRARPGSTVRLTGTGFGPGMHVIVGGEDMPHGDTVLIDSNSAEFRVVRPQSLASSSRAAGVLDEETDVRILLADRRPESTSNALPITLATAWLLAFGDSIMWGQGLRALPRSSDS